MNTHQKFLKFNEHKIMFVYENGTYWIVLKPICDALNLNSDRAYAAIKNDLILGSVHTVLRVQLFKNGIKQGRKMMCIPEKYIYGWIFSLKANNPELIEYKKTCYELLFNHFHGTITNRTEILHSRNYVDDRIKELKFKLKDEIDPYKELQKLLDERKTLNAQLNSIDKDLLKQPELFSEN